jgi:hypothetical protein
LLLRKADIAEDKEVESTNSNPIFDGEEARNRPMRVLKFFQHRRKKLVRENIKVVSQFVASDFHRLLGSQMHELLPSGDGAAKLCGMLPAAYI